MGRFDLPEERGQKRHVHTGRARRLLKLGNLAASVSSRMFKGRIRRSFLSEEDASRDRLASAVAIAERVVATMGEMKGAAMKIGQMLSQGITDLPGEVLDTLARLQDEAPPMDFPLVSAQIEAAFDLPIHEVFRTFDYRPIASASIGQVHRAVLPDGTPVAVKVQYPGVAESLDSDLDNMRMMMRFARVVVKGEVVEAYHREVRDVLRGELDYEREAANLERFRAIYHPEGEGTAAFAGRVRVPRVYRAFTRRTVLTMEYLEGEKLDAYLDRVEDPQERRDTAMLLFEVFARMFHELQLLHADPHPGNYLLDREGRLILLDYGCVRDFRPAFTDGFLRVVAAARGERWDALPELLEGLGWHNVGRVDPERLAELVRLVLAPYLADGPFPLGRWDVQRQVQDFLKRNWSFVHFQPPSEAIFFFRTCAGLLGHMRRLDAHGDYAAILSQILDRRGIER